MKAKSGPGNATTRHSEQPDIPDTTAGHIQTPKSEFRPAFPRKAVGFHVSVSGSPGGLHYQ